MNLILRLKREKNLTENLKDINFITQIKEITF